MLTIAGGILIAVGIVIGGSILMAILGIPFGLAFLAWPRKQKKPLPVRHYYDELPDHLGGSDNV